MYEIPVSENRGRGRWRKKERGKGEEEKGEAYNCRHIPHGLAGGEISVATARALKLLWPSIYAAPSPGKHQLSYSTLLLPLQRANNDTRNHFPTTTTRYQEGGHHRRRLTTALPNATLSAQVPTG